MMTDEEIREVLEEEDRQKDHEERLKEAAENEDPFYNLPDGELIEGYCIPPCWCMWGRRYDE